MFHIFLAAADKNTASRKLKHNIIEAVNELIQDIATCHEQIAEQAVEHIHHKYLPSPSLLFCYQFYFPFIFMIFGVALDLVGYDKLSCILMVVDLC